MRSSQGLASVVVVYDRAVGMAWSQRRSQAFFKFRGTLIWARSCRWSFGVGWQPYTKQTTQKEKKDGGFRGWFSTRYTLCADPNRKAEKEHQKGSEKGMEMDVREEEQAS